MFLQIHTLTAYPASLLNRDEAGLAKRIPFGNAVRLRISSQCLKRSWRESLVDFGSLEAKACHIPDGYRSRRIFELIRSKLRERGIESDKAEILAKCVKNLTMKSSKEPDDNEAGDEGNNSLRIKQPIFLSSREVDFLLKVAEDIRRVDSDLDNALALSEGIKKNDRRLREKRKFREQLGLSKDNREAMDNLQAMQKSAIGFSPALFGRMVTSDLLARVDAPVHVAHAFTVHAANTEMDYFTVVDDLNRDDETGAAHANQMELGSGLYYGYVAVDVPLLVSNLTGADRKDWRAQDTATARRVLEALIDAILRQSPGAKKGSTAPYAWADVLFLETGRSQPRALSNAFLDALRPDGKTDLRVAALARLGEYVGQIDDMYGSPADGENRFLSTTLEQPQHLPLKQPVSQAVEAALDGIFGPHA
jgi:CRISPR system Cascade subunit CasC